MHGRDLVTRPDGSAIAVARENFAAAVDNDADGTVTYVGPADHPEPRLQQLVGRTVRSGFRRCVAEQLPNQRETASLLHLLLDDTPMALMLTGQAVYAAGLFPMATFSSVVDVCSGWRTGGTIDVAIAMSGRPPVVTGPPARTQLREDDPLAWHELPDLPPHAMRRMRRIDIEPAGSALRFNGFYQDSHVAGDGFETSIHEYTYSGCVDSATLTFDELSAQARVLPWQECMPAVDSAARLVGASVEDLRSHVRREFHGISTCTHLNDTMRGLEDLPALARLVEATPPLSRCGR